MGLDFGSIVLYISKYNQDLIPEPRGAMTAMDDVRDLLGGPGGKAAG
jgi:hypothetical protein